ncbi:MAG: SpoIIE family protein phosphatase [Candidatus Metalachnospira sp.]|nr:SpoIIE family protein phosphatase [Candidatus Metalachnospira sp.]
MDKKRRPIRKKVQAMVLAISVTALLLTSVVSIFSMLTIQNDVLSAGKALGDTAAKNGEDALLEQMEQNLLDIVSSKAKLADSQLGRFSAYTDQFAAYAHSLYSSPSNFVPVEVLPPNKENLNKLTMQRYLAKESIELADVHSEINLLGNLEHVFRPVITDEKEMITTIYIGTESGFMLSYDNRADLGDTTAAEEYYDYFDSSWYTAAKEAGKTIFTDTYPDTYGRGLTISCAAPFYDENNHFAGVVCMDILITDLNRTIIDIDIGENSYAMLIDKKGRVIASPQMASEQTEFDDILKDTSLPAYEVKDEIMSGNTGVALTSQGIYYAYTPVASADWVLAIHVPASDITEPVAQIRENINSKTDDTAASMSRNIRTTILIFVVSFAVIIIIVVILARRFAAQLTKPLLSLRNDVGEISGGNLKYRAEIHDNDEIGDLAGSFNNMALSLEQYINDLTLVTAEKERIGAELDVAKHIQASMLPCIFPAFPERPELDIYATMTPAKEVGGDFYDFFLVDDDRLAMVMADVSGKGVPAALFMVIAKTLLKNVAQTGLSPKDVLEKVNNQLCVNNEAEMFVTVWLGILEISTGKLTCANAGHEYPVLKREGGDYELVKDKHGFVLAGMEGSRYKEYELQMEPGDKLFLYTDGVAEATDANNQLYGTERMLAALNRNRDVDCKTLLNCMQEEIDAFVGETPQFDDITMLSLDMMHQNGPGMKKLKLNPTLESMEQITAFVEQELENGGIPMKIIVQMNIAVDEIFSNIARYSGANDVTVGVFVKEGHITLRFADNGRPYDPTEKPDPDTSLSAEERDIGGLGIFMVKKSMDTVEYEYHDGLNILTLTKQN